MLTVLQSVAALLLLFLVVIIVNARIRKQVLIFTTYVSLTGWYYYRKWEKSHSGGAPASRPKSRASGTRKKQLDSDTDVRFFEPPDKVLQEELDRTSDNSYRLSESSSSGHSEDVKGGSKKGGLLGKLRKEKVDSTTESVTSSQRSDASVSSVSRRTYSGRKKPASWGE